MDLELWYRYFTENGFEKVKMINSILSNFRYHNTSKSIAEYKLFLKDKAAIIRSVVKSASISEEISDLFRYMDYNKEYNAIYNIKKIDKKLLEAYTMEWLSIHSIRVRGVSKSFNLFLKSVFKRPIRSYAYLLYYLSIKYLSPKFRKRIRSVFIKSYSR